MVCSAPASARSTGCCAALFVLAAALCTRLGQACQADLCACVQFGHLFAKAATREAAIRAMVAALREVRIRGEIRTTTDYVCDMIQTPDFVGNSIHTGWLDNRIASHVRPLLLGSRWCGPSQTDASLHGCSCREACGLQCSCRMAGVSLALCWQAQLCTGLSCWCVWLVLQTGPCGYTFDAQRMLARQRMAACHVQAASLS